MARLVEAYHAFEDADRFAHVADLEEIQGNDFNLNISRYVDTTEPVEVMSVEEALAEQRAIAAALGNGYAKMAEEFSRGRAAHRARASGGMN